jgi:hypothetical protein
LLILGVGFAAGLINAMAAGGSLLTLPMLIFLGLPSAEANGTNRVALVVQSYVATRTFYKKGHFDKTLALWLGIPGIIGSIVGANLAITITDELFNMILAIMMVITVIFIIWQPNTESKIAQNGEYSIPRKVIGVIAFFFIGIYSGFIQAGVGFFMIAALTAIFGMSLVKSNGMKVFLTGAYIFISLIVFIIHGQVHWGIGITLAIGNASGAWVGSNLAINKGEKWIKAFLFITVLFMAAELLGVF